MRVLGFLTLVAIVLAVGVVVGRAHSHPGAQVVAGAPAVGTVSAQTRTDDPGSSSNRADAPTPASIPTLGVRLSGGRDRVEALREANGLVNPRGFHLRTGQPVAADLPAGVAADVWDCFAATHVAGPAHLSQVCEMTVRAE